MAKQVLFTNRHAKSYKTRENACVAIQNLERELVEARFISDKPLRYVLSVCPESGRFIPVILQASIPEEALGAVVHSGFCIAG
tara:strand:- start:1388 stop:1636 length:249 start_codon:yes stop_codon:yes gene_type:complete